MLFSAANVIERLPTRPVYLQTWTFTLVNIAFDMTAQVRCMTVAADPSPYVAEVAKPFARIDLQHSGSWPLVVWVRGIVTRHREEHTGLLLR